MDDLTFYLLPFPEESIIDMHPCLTSVCEMLDIKTLAFT